MENFWDNRYSMANYIYGLEPNNFFKESIKKVEPGNILFPAEGEGRNAVFAAKLGFNVTAFDTSSEGKKKALTLASENKVEIDYLLESYESIKLKENNYDAIALIFAHMIPDERQRYHRKLITYLKPGGMLILQGFSKEQINFSSGGPRDINMLFSEEELESDFEGMKTLKINHERTILNEGDFHKGEAAVVNFIGIK